MLLYQTRAIIKLTPYPFIGQTSVSLEDEHYSS